MPPADPRLTAEQAFDAAAYIESQSRPVEPDIAKDYPDRALKPADVSYPPYADSFSVEQHTYGPFGPILQAADEREKRR
jgi:thiosulfate dehydrogenase